MLETLAWNWSIDGWIVAAAVLCAVAASVLGNFLVLRRMSMLGDAISHAVLPGLAAAFFISESRNSLPMVIGAVIVGVMTAFFTQWIHRVGRVDEGASMGVVFTSLFAVGLLMIVQAADNVDLDPDCVLYGAIELTPFSKTALWGYRIPTAVITLGVVALINCTFVAVFYKELKVSSFDPALSTALGFHAGIMHYLLMILVAVTAVASFESVGNVLVVAMFVVPPAAASLLTRRLPIMILLSVVIAASSAVVGHISAILVPAQFGFESTTTASMMAVVAGLVLAAAALFGPQQGIFARLLRRQLLSFQIVADDIVALLFRLEEHPQTQTASSEVINVQRLSQLLLSGPLLTRLMARRLISRGEVVSDGEHLSLTNTGRARAQNIVRSHRLWEQYLQEHAGVASDRVHRPAERMEHFTDVQLRDRLNAETNAPQQDPHGKPIPGEHEKAVSKTKRNRSKRGE
ncbi:MAG: iron chelate uptake ABC transporter family permease subunit [Aureliella sp.]